MGGGLTWCVFMIMELVGKTGYCNEATNIVCMGACTEEWRRARKDLGTLIAIFSASTG